MSRHPLRWLKSRFVRDAATLQLASFLNQGSQLLSTVAIAFLLGSHGQGLFVAAVALQALLFFLVNLGVTETVVTQIASAAARKNDFKVAGWIAFMAKFVAVFGIGVLALGWVLLPWVSERFYGDRQIGQWALWLCLVPLLELPRTVAQIAFLGTRRMLALAQVENAHELVRFYLVVLGALIDPTPRGPILGMLATSLVSTVLAVALYHQARRDGGTPLPGPLAILRRVRDVQIRQGIRQGLRIAFLRNGDALFGVVFPRLIIGGVAGMNWVAYFHIAQRFLSVPMLLANGVARTMLPALGEIAGLRDLEQFRRLFVRVTLVTGTLISAALLVTLAALPWVVPLLFPEDYAEPVFHYAWILVIGAVPFSFAVGVTSFFVATNQIKAWLSLTLLGAAITIPLNVWLIVKIPYTGTAWGLSLYQSWALVLLGYILWFLYRSRRRHEVWAPAEERQGGGERESQEGPMVSARERGEG